MRGRVQRDVVSDAAHDRLTGIEHGGELLMRSLPRERRDGEFLGPPHVRVVR